jgi:hypothetical protein
VTRIDIFLCRQLDSAQLPAESRLHTRRRNISCRFARDGTMRLP